MNGKRCRGYNENGDDTLRAGWAWLMFALLIVPIVAADWQSDGSCQSGTYCTVNVLLLNDSLTPVNSPEGNCNLTVYRNQTLLFKQNMTNWGNGYWNATINGTVNTKYPANVQCAIGNQTAISDVTFVMGGELNMAWQMIAPLSFFLIGALMLGISFYYARNKEGMLNVLFKHLGMLVSFTSLLLGTQATVELLEFVNTTNNANLNDIISLLNSSYYVLMIVMMLLFVFICIDMFKRTVSMLELKKERARDAEVRDE